MPKGQTPPGACPTSSSTEAPGIIEAFTPNRSLYLRLSIFTLPAATISTGLPFWRKESVLAMRSTPTPTVAAASSTVAIVVSLVMMRVPNSFLIKSAQAASCDMKAPPWKRKQIIRS